jgi:hypothetical protein
VLPTTIKESILKKHFFFIAGLLLFLCACAPNVSERPSEPDLFVKPERYNFSSRINSLEHVAMFSVWDEAKLIYPGDFSREMREMSAEVDWAEVEDYYQTVLLAEEGWEKETRFSDLTDLAHVTAFRNGDYFIAIVGLKYGAGGQIPIDIITNIPDQ